MRTLAYLVGSTTFSSALILGACGTATRPITPMVVLPKVETVPTQSDDDAADDPAVWVHPKNPSQSLIFGSDKSMGLGAYRLDGSLAFFERLGAVNNVDVAQGVRTPAGVIDIVMGTADEAGVLVAWSIDPESGALTRVDGGGIPTSLPDIYGFALGVVEGDHYAFTTSKAGLLEVTGLSFESGALSANHIATVPVGTQLEGVVIDDAHKAVYVGEETVGIWRYQLPIQGTDVETWDEFGEVRTLVDTCRDTQGDGHLVSDVEGLTIWRDPSYPGANGGYLIASSQGDDRYCVYDRAGQNAYLGTFRIGESIGEGGTIDAVTHTDGITVCAHPLGDAFPNGVFVVQDDENGSERQNFKLVPWELIERALDLD